MQDTDSTRPLFADEELDFLISSEHNIWMAAAAACDAQATRQSAIRSKSVGGLSIAYFSPDEWKSRAAMLRARGAAHMVLTAGGVKVDDRATLAEDDTLLQPYFRLGLHDNRSQPAGEPEKEL